VNKHFEKQKLKYETLAILKYAPQEVQYGVSLDISDAYHHLRLAPAIQKYFTFQIDGILY
jgi:hypothetical protein